jgi:hypothetical protein
LGTGSIEHMDSAAYSDVLNYDGFSRHHFSQSPP